MLDSRIRRRLAVGLTNVTDDETGQGLVEYAFMILLVALVAILALTTLGTSLQDTIDFVVGQFP